MNKSLYVKNLKLSPQKHSDLFFPALLLVTMAAGTITVAAKAVPNYFIYLNGLQGLSALMITLLKTVKKTSADRKIPFLKINHDSIEYYSEDISNLITIEAEEIVGISTQFRKLNVHTRNNKVHCISMDSIKSEKDRWEIKELTRKLARDKHLTVAG